MATSDMGAERGRDAGIGGASTDRKGAESGANRDDRRSKEKAARSKATKSKQADLQSFGATPTSAEPSPQEAQALGKAIDQLNDNRSGFGGFVSDLFGIRQEVALNPKTTQWDVKSYKEFNPIETMIGVAASQLAGPFASPVVDGVLSAIGFEDPLGFEVDLGFASDKPATSGRDPEKDRADRISRAAETSTPAAAAGEISEKENAIDLAVKDLMEGDKKFTFFDMPQFKLLDPNFGKGGPQELSLAELLLGGEQKETA